VHTATLDCTTCTNGLLVFMTRADDEGAVLLECDECMSVYTDVVGEGELVRWGWEFDLDSDTSPATEPQIRSRGWEPFVDRRSRYRRVWLRRCPHGDEGVIRPLLTASGRVVLLCESGREVWLDPGEVSAGSSVRPGSPSWRVAEGVHVRPRTTRWAHADELPETWGSYAWHDG
jgi:hypothetical protein